MIAYTVLVSFGMRTVSFLERLFSPGIGSYAANLTEVKTRMPNAKVLSEKQAIVASLTEKSKRLPLLNDELDEKTMRWLELSEIEG